MTSPPSRPKSKRVAPPSAAPTAAVDADVAAREAVPLPSPYTDIAFSMRTLGAAQAAISQRDRAQQAALTAFTEKQQKAIADATKEFCCVPNEPSQSTRADHNNTTTSNLIEHCDSAIRSILNAYPQASAVLNDAARSEWQRERTIFTWDIISRVITSAMSAPGINDERQSKMLQCVGEISTLAATDALVMFKDDNKAVLSHTDRPWASTFRDQLSPNTLIGQTERLTSGDSVAAYVANNKTWLHETRDASLSMMEQVHDTHVTMAAVCQYRLTYHDDL